MAEKQPTNKDDRLDGQRANPERPNERNRENRPPTPDDVERQRAATRQKISKV